MHKFPNIMMTDAELWKGEYNDCDEERRDKYREDQYQRCIVSSSHTFPTQDARKQYPPHGSHNSGATVNSTITVHTAGKSSHPEWL